MYVHIVKVGVADDDDVVAGVFAEMVEVLKCIPFERRY